MHQSTNGPPGATQNAQRRARIVTKGLINGRAVNGIGRRERRLAYGQSPNGNWTSRGLVNGDGLINGGSLTNGLDPDRSDRGRIHLKRRRRRRTVVTAFLVALLLIVPTVVGSAVARRRKRK